MLWWLRYKGYIFNSILDAFCCGTDGVYERCSANFTS